MLSEEEFKNLALLSRLSPDDPDLMQLKNDLSAILDFVAHIQDYKGIIPDELKGRPGTFRADSPLPSLGQDVLANMAPEWESGHFVVPQVIEIE